ncbi:hypothetical protein K523DRAFT_388025 [Schizophyllum commune Tattone D]|nr:hypothetical protein K523DRAFT_388025 [Schizophyllum commune Tattone D]
MNQRAPRYLSELISQELNKTFGRQKRFMPTKGISLRLYKELLGNLSIENVPASQPSTRAEWLNVVNAVDSIFAVAHMLDAYHPATPLTIFDEIISDTLPPIFKWLLYLHPNAYNCDVEALEVAMARYGWGSPDRGNGGFGTVICRFFVAMCRVPSGPDALLAHPESATSYMFDIWHLRVQKFSENKVPDWHTTKILAALPAIRTIMRRLRAVAAAPPNLDYGEALHLNLLVLGLLQQETALPLLRPLLWLVAPLLRLIHHPSLLRYATMDDKNDPSKKPFLKCHADNTWFILHYLEPELRGTRDVIRLAAYDHLTRWAHLREPVNDCSVSPLLHSIIGPALVFPSVAKVILKKNRHCYNTGCQHHQDQSKLKRCACDRACYCSKACQVADRPRHRVICQPISISNDLHAFQLDRPSDKYFIRSYAKQVLCMRNWAHEGNSRVLDLASRMQPQSHLLTEAADGRMIYVEVGVSTVRTSLYIPVPIL